MKYKECEERIKQNQSKVNRVAQNIETVTDTGEILRDKKPSGRKENWKKLKIQSRKVWKLW